MKTFRDGNAVFVADDDFVDLQESQTVFGDTHEFCVAAAIAMVTNGAIKHFSFITPDDLNETTYGLLKADGIILKVTIEWVDESEAHEENP